MEQYGWQLTTIAIALSIVAAGMMAILVALIFLVIGTAKVVKHLDRLMDQADYLMTKARLWSLEVEEKARHAGMYVDAMNWNLKTGLRMLAAILAAFKAAGGILSSALGKKGGNDE